MSAEIRFRAGKLAVGVDTRDRHLLGNSEDERLQRVASTFEDSLEDTSEARGHVDGQSAGAFERRSQSFGPRTTRQGVVDACTGAGSSRTRRDPLPQPTREEPQTAGDGPRERRDRKDRSSQCQGKHGLGAH